jgi:hypothetical protein
LSERSSLSMWTWFTFNLNVAHSCLTVVKLLVRTYFTFCLNIIHSLSEQWT